MRLVLALCVLAAVPILAAAPARADLKVCNDTDRLLGVAVGYRAGGTWISEGWWRIAPKACTAVIEGDLDARFFYVHAEDDRAGNRWGGPVMMCTSIKEFRVEGLTDCYPRGYERTGFFEVDTGDQRNWQVRLTPQDAGKPGSGGTAPRTAPATGTDG